MKTLFFNQKNSKKDFANFEILTNNELCAVRGGDGDNPNQPSGGPDDWGLPKRKSTDF